MENRLDRDSYYLNIAKEVAMRGTCYRARIGSVIVRDGQIVATGYIGAPRKTKDCFQHGNCLREKLNIPRGQRYELCRSVHSEMNAIINSARAGVSLLGGDMYIYGQKEPDGSLMDAFPCFICKKMIINAGINKVISSTKDGGIKIFNIDDWVKDWSEKDIIDDKCRYGE